MVEEYRNTEIADICDDEQKTAEWRNMVDALELEGQSNIADANNSIIPFQLMTKEMMNVYKTLCPDKATYMNFSNEPYPLRVLEIIDESVRRAYFPKGIYVWYNRNHVDPILVGAAPVPGQQWGEQYYILARWGDELCSYNELKARAVKLFIEQRKFEFIKARHTLDAMLADMEAYAYSFLSGKDNDYNMPF
jgi:hypothetical protein